jgi:flagellar assembly protein FliH
MRSLSKVLKDMDIVIDSPCLVLDRANDTEKAKGALRSIETDKAHTKDNKLLLQARIQSHQIIENAKEQADIILANAASKAKDEYEGARIKGYAEGVAQGKQEARKMAAASVAELKSLIRAMDGQKQSIMKEYEEDLKNLVLDTAKKIIDLQLEKDDQLFLSLYQKAVRQYNEQEWVKISVSEFEAEFVTTNAQTLLSMAKGATDLQIQVLPDMPRGTCIVETPISIIDASVTTQLLKLEESFSNLSV